MTTTATVTAATAAGDKNLATAVGRAMAVEGVDGPQDLLAVVLMQRLGARPQEAS